MDGLKTKTIQITLIIFSGILFLCGIYMILMGDSQTISLIAIFGPALLLLIVAAINPNIIKIWAGKEGWGLGLTRHHPGEKEKEAALKASEDELTSSESERIKYLFEAAENRSNDKRSPEDYLLLATDAWRKKEYDKALTYVYSGLSLEPEDAKVKATLMHRQGSIYGSLGKNYAAIEMCKQAIDIKSDFSWPYHNLGQLYKNLKQYPEAEESFKKAIELDPKLSHPHNGLGSLYEKMGRLENAKMEYERAIELDPNFEKAKNNLENLLRRMKDN